MEVQALSRLTPEQLDTHIAKKINRNAAWSQDLMSSLGEIERLSEERSFSWALERHPVLRAIPNRKYSFAVIGGDIAYPADQRMFRVWAESRELAAARALLWVLTHYEPDSRPLE